MDDTSSTLLRLIGIEQWVPRQTVPAVAPAAAPTLAPGLVPGATRRRVDVSGAGTGAGTGARSGAGAAAGTSVAERLPRVGERPAAPSVATAASAATWQLQLDLYASADVLVVLEQAVALPQRFVRDICAAIGNRHEPLQALEDFSWPPPGRVDLAQRGACRSALMAVLGRLWHERGLAAVVLFGPALCALCSAGAGAALVREEQAGMQLLLVADPATLLVDPQTKRALWTQIQRGPAPAQ